jgi:hypothetical protein
MEDDAKRMTGVNECEERKERQSRRGLQWVRKGGQQRLSLIVTGCRRVGGCRIGWLPWSTLGRGPPPEVMHSTACD